MFATTDTARKTALRSLKTRRSIPRLTACDTFERRDLPTVTAALVGTTLTLTGDNTNNKIKMSQPDPSDQRMFLIEGVNGTTVTYKGITAAFHFIRNVNNLTVRMGSANDELSLENLRLRQLQVNFGLGEGKFVAQNCYITRGTSVQGSGGRQEWSIAGVYLGGNAQFSTGAANDLLRMNAVCQGSLTINTQDGEDGVFFENAGLSPNVMQGNVSINTGAQRDGVVVRSGVFNAGFSLDAGEGNNVLAMSNATIAGNTSIRTSGGIDTLNLQSMKFLNNVNLNMNAGSDFLTAGNLIVDGSLSIDMGTGDDSVVMRRFDVVDNLSLNTGAGLDSAELAGLETVAQNYLATVGSRTQVDLGSDRDSLTMYRLRCSDTATFALGSGSNDFLQLDDSQMDAAFQVTASGTNTVVNIEQNFGRLSSVHFTGPVQINATGPSALINISALSNNTATVFSSTLRINGGNPRANVRLVSGTTFLNSPPTLTNAVLTII